MRSFVAISLQVNESLKELIRGCESMGKVVKGSDLHLTLKFLGEVEDIGAIRKSLEEVRFKKFPLMVEGLGAFPSGYRGRVLFVGASPEDILKELAGEVDSRTKEIPLDHPFTPHITILRTREPRNFSGLISNYEGKTFLEQNVDSFTLYESVLKPTGPIYSEIQKYQLM